MINPGEIPQIPGNMESLAGHAQTITTTGGDFAETGGAVDSTWQGLAAGYQAPEAAQLFAATGPVRTVSASVGEDIGSVGAALATYASEVKEIKAQLASLKIQAQDFVGSVNGGDEWREDEGKVDEHNGLLSAVNAQVAAFFEAQRKCANTINALYGGRQYRADNGDGQAEDGEYGFTADMLNAALGEDGGLPWGSSEEHDRGFWGDVGAFFGGIGEGFMTMVEDLGALIGRDPETGEWSWGTAGNAWKGLGTFVYALAIYTNPVTIVMDQTVGMPGFDRGGAGNLLLGAGKSIIAYDTWGEDKSKAAGLATFNIVSAVVGTKGAGAGLRGTGAALNGVRGSATAARLGAGAIRAGNWIDNLPTVGETALNFAKKFDINIPNLSGLVPSFAGDVPPGGFRFDFDLPSDRGAGPPHLDVGNGPGGNGPGGNGPGGNGPGGNGPGGNFPDGSTPGTNGAGGNGPGGNGPGGNGPDGNSPPSDGTPTERIPSDGTPTERIPSDGTPTERIPSDGTPTERIPSDGTPTERFPSDGTPTERIPSDGTPTERIPSDGTPTERIPSDGTPTERIPSDGTPTERIPSDGTPGDGTPGDGTPGDGTPGDGNQPGDGSSADLPGDNPPDSPSPDPSAANPPDQGPGNSPDASSPDPRPQSARELDLQNRQIVGLDNLGSGGNVNEAFKATLDDGRHAAYKPESGEATNGMRHDITSDLGRREVAASRVDEMLGFGRVPTTAWTDGVPPHGPGSLQEFAENSSRSLDAGDYPRTQQQQMAVLDYITGNTDRHVDNYLTDPDGNPVAIDNGFSFPDGERDAIRSDFVRDHLNKPLDQDIMAAVRGVDPTEMRRMLEDSGLSPNAAELAVRRLEEIQHNGMITGEGWRGPIVDAWWNPVRGPLP